MILEHGKSIIRFQASMFAKTTKSQFGRSVTKWRYSSKTIWRKNLFCVLIKYKTETKRFIETYERYGRYQFFLFSLESDSRVWNLDETTSGVGIAWGIGSLVNGWSTDRVLARSVGAQQLGRLKTRVGN